ncbi:sucrase ferredoxin [Dietzia sp. DQ12-76]|nr:sucrase ferredoxin [Dietzia sp. DQ11-38-2]MBB1025625.1 sucrase ferredoxin [Dietzia sp. DQ12-76]MBB1028354.1 sucrase ferredoxin [Dietzia sp. DQ11-38-2]
MGHHGVVSDTDSATHPGWCSLQSADEPPAGTAAHEESWVLLEVPGRWGRDIFDGEALGEDLSRRLKEHIADCGSRMLFIRRPGREGQRLDRHRFYLCDTRPDRQSIRAGRVDGPEELLGLDLSPDGHVAGTREVAAPVPLVCTHAKRDQCCAVRGRPVAAGLESMLGGRLAALDPDAAVWECSHTGGHRFAPVLLLPGTGYTYGPAEVAHAAGIVEAALDGRVVTENLRGRSTWPPAGQVAEVAVRNSGVEAGPGDLVVTIDPDSPRVAVVRHTDGRAWRVEAGTRPLPPRSQSCRKPPGEASAWVVESFTQL